MTPTRAAAIVAVFAYMFFWAWYGGSGDPLTADETQRLLATVESNARARGATPDAELLEGLRELASHDDGDEYYMLNLMKYRDKAVYPPGLDFGDDVEAAKRRYNEAIIPELLERGSLPILVGAQAGTFLQPAGADVWDDVALVRYRSRRDMLEMVVEISSREVGIHKWASIEKTQVFPVKPGFDFVFVRGAVAGVLASIVGLVAFLSRIRRGRAPV